MITQAGVVSDPEPSPESR